MYPDSDDQDMRYIRTMENDGYKLFSLFKAIVPTAERQAKHIISTIVMQKSKGLKL